MQICFYFNQNRMIFSCAVSFESKKKKIPDLSLPPCILFTLKLLVSWQYYRHLQYILQNPHYDDNSML